ncbi:Sulfatase-modifying factor 2 [Hondaea fermentalgiana]|uniref:Sulfatase-modifying factor 2 n=1 Tax=Hondaea fermentalgiana TaxID=2315210 RepID=A0A2R5GLS5_9STRA|nr:Sulfatase-modifying factor 2 [Hondaea fermentalgiana]|eukprot:GBG31852.1 Sulfatase-modifying factor 2 [Hondaea fermentalgiana]
MRTWTALTVACMAFATQASLSFGETEDAFASKMVTLDGGDFVMGDSLSTKLHPQALPPQRVHVDAFRVDKWPATNREFREFVRATKFKTDSEKFGWSFVLDYQATERARELSESQVKDASHWLAVPQAYWRQPDGPGSGIQDTLDHVAGHLSYNDAKAFCKWRGLRLLSESEWEFAARGGEVDTKYPWGNNEPWKETDGSWPMNVWQGTFPKENDLGDGYATTSPPQAFPPNKYGLYDVLGNVWEWTKTKYLEMHPDAIKQDQQRKGEAVQRVLRGGSFLDTADGAFNHKVDLNTRMGNTEDSASSNTGVRCAASVGPQSKESGYKYRKPSKPKGAGGIPGLDQETMQRIVEEGGIEALQELLGDKATVTTAGELKERQAKMHRQMEELRRMEELEKQQATRGGGDSAEHIEL